MSKYLQGNCPYCDKKITREDELAVCPDCGAPHHRQCYLDHGQCFYHDRHAEEFEWTPEQPAAIDPPDLPQVACSNCGKGNPYDSAFCNACGSRISPYAGRGTQQQQKSFFPFTVQHTSPGPDYTYRPDETIDGIPAKDWATYIGDNASRYFFQFRMQEKTGKRTRFTASAMIFPTLYFLYRRVWPMAILSFLLNFLLRLPSFAFTFLIPLGVPVFIPSPILQSLTQIFSPVLFVVNFCWGLFALQLYRTSASKKMQKLKELSTSDDEYHSRLNAISGPSKIAVILMVSFGISLTFFYAFLLSLSGFAA